MEILKKPEKLFLIFATLCGLILTFFMPPLMGADEPAHLARIYSLSQGQISSIVVNNQAGNYTPAALSDFENFWTPIIKDTKIKTNFSQIKKSTQFVIDKNKLSFTNQCYQTLYSPIAYLPQTLGLSVAKLFTNSVYWLLICSKLFLLSFYIAIGYLTIRVTPVFKNIFMLVLLMPTALSLGASISADGVIIPVAALFFAYVLRYSFDDNLKIDKKAVILFSLLTICLALVKQSFLISLFVLFIPKKKFGKSMKSYFAKLAFIFLPGFILAVLWNLYCREWFVPLNGSNAIVQAQFILEHPFIYILTLLKTIKLCFIMWVYMTIGVLGWNNVFLFPVVYILYIIAFIINLVFKNESDRVPVELWQKILLGILFAINFIFIATELYLSWTQPYFTEFISFIQGRYIIPIILPLLILTGFIFVSSKNKNTKSDIITLSILAITYLNIFLSIFVLYYF